MQQMTPSFPTPVFSSAGRGWKGIELLQFKGTVEENSYTLLPVPRRSHWRLAAPGRCGAEA
jgi:hypothetical protein